MKLKLTILLIVAVLLCAVPSLAQIILQPPSSSTGTVVTIEAGQSTSSDLLDIFCTNGASQACFKFEQNGTFFFTGNTAAYGTNNQSSASEITLYGGLPDQAFLQESSAALSPPATPTTGSTSGGSLSQQKLYVEITYVNGAASPGETTVSGETAQKTINANNLLTISNPGSSGNATGWRPYVTMSNGGTCTETLQSLSGCSSENTAMTGCAIGATWTEPTGGITSGANPPSSTTTGGLYSGYWFISGSSQGVPCFSSSVPGADCTTGNGGSVLAFNPMTAAGDMIVGGSVPSTGLGIAPPQVLHASGTNTYLSWTGSTESWTQPCLLSYGVEAKTTSYTLAGSDVGSLVTFNGSSLTATLPAPAPTSTWCVSIENLNGTSLTVSPNSHHINGGTSSLSLGQYQTVTIWADGTNYFSSPVYAAASPITLTAASNGITVGVTLKRVT